MTKRAILWIAVSSGAQAEDDKVSLPEQSRRLRELAESQHWQIVDTISVPGHSRVYYNFREFADAAASEGITAPLRMFDHWQAGDFDVLACLSGDRFGREQSIFAEVVARTIDAGASVWTLRDGEINVDNRRMFVSMAGYQASVEIDELKRRRRIGMAKRAKQGLPTASGGHILSHTVIDLPDGTQKTVVNESARRLFLDIADLLLAGLSWRQLPAALAERGHRRTDGRPLSKSTIEKWLMHPTLWGNSAQHFMGVGFRARGLWGFDPDEPAPPQVTIHYDTHEPMYTGELGEAVKAELRRRFSPGRAHPPYKGKFTGLVLCDDCHYYLNYARRPGYAALRCTSPNNDRPVACSNRRYVNEKQAIMRMTELLQKLEAGQWEVLYPAVPEDDTDQRLALLDQEIADTRARASVLISKQAAAPPTLADVYDQQIQVLGETLHALDAERQRLENDRRVQTPMPGQYRVLEQILEVGIDKFWELPDQQINQWLTRLLRNRRLIASDGDITHTVPIARRFSGGKDI